MTDPLPLTEEEERGVREAHHSGLMPLPMAITRLFITLDRARRELAEAKESLADGARLIVKGAQKQIAVARERDAAVEALRAYRAFDESLSVPPSELTAESSKAGGEALKRARELARAILDTDEGRRARAVVGGSNG